MAEMKYNVHKYAFISVKRDKTLKHPQCDLFLSVFVGLNGVKHTSLSFSCLWLVKTASFLHLY